MCGGFHAFVSISLCAVMHKVVMSQHSMHQPMPDLAFFQDYIDYIIVTFKRVRSLFFRPFHLLSLPRCDSMHV